MLIDTIEDAQYLVANTDVGTEPGQVTQTAKDNLGTAITTAEGVLNDEDATQTDIDNAVMALVEAIVAFEEVVVEPDEVDPELLSVSPSADEAVEVAHDGTFTLQVAASDDNLRELEVDHNIDSLPEFSVYASEENPYGTAELKAQFEAKGVTVQYDADTQTWDIDFGSEVTSDIVANGNVTFYTVLKDEAGNTAGSMDPTTADNTFAYTVTQADAPDTVVTTLNMGGNFVIQNGFVKFI